MRDFLQKVATVVQVRRGSTRLPNKVLLPLRNKPLFIRQVERIRGSILNGTVVVATTAREEDDLIESICSIEDIPVYRGNTFDLLDRHYQAAKLRDADFVVKIPSDCPLISPSIINSVIRYFQQNYLEYDYVSNLHPASYPDGNDVEIMSFKALESAWKNASKNFEREHTTPYLWRNPDKFRIGNVMWEENKDYSMSYRWTIDYPEDYDLIKKLFETLYPQNELFDIKDILSLLEKQPGLMVINEHLAGINWYRNHLDELKGINHIRTKKIE